MPELRNSIFRVDRYKYVHTYIYLHICIHLFVCTYIYIHPYGGTSLTATQSHLPCGSKALQHVRIVQVQRCTGRSTDHRGTFLNLSRQVGDTPDSTKGLNSGIRQNWFQDCLQDPNPKAWV